MFKRANKITALVVAAASIMSVVPAMAADSTRLGTRKGSVKEAYAYDGKYVYEGYKGDADRAVYSNENGSEKVLDALNNVGFSSSGAKVTKFGDKYIEIQDGKDEYAVDLSTMKVYDDDDSKLAKSIAESAARKVKNKLKNTDKYQDNYEFDDEALDVNRTTKSDYFTTTGKDGFETAFKDQFGDTWFQFTTGVSASTTPQSVVFNTAGQYVDITNDVNIKLYDKEKKLITVEEYGKWYGNKDSKGDRRIKVELNGAPKVIAQDKDYIYLLTKVKVEGAINIHKEKVGGEFQTLDTLNLVQKVSKAQGEKVEKAYLPKTTQSYIYTDDDDLFKVDDAEKAGEALVKVDNKEAEVRAIDGALYVTYLEDGKVHVYEIKLNSHGRTEALSELKEEGKHVKYDIYTAVKGEDDDEDSDGYSIDVNGTVWSIHDGDIKKSTKAKEFQQVYDVDSSIDALDVYNEGNLIAWSTTSDRYTTITEGKKQTTDDAIVVDPNVNADKFKTGFDATTKKYYENGALVTNKWVSVDGKWYFVDENSTAKTGWFKNAQGTYYYLQADGAMLTGWFKDPADGNYYYLEPINSNGAMKTGWFQDTTGTWYYADGSGKMLSNQYVGGYWLSGSGAWVQ